MAVRRNTARAAAGLQLAPPEPHPLLQAALLLDHLGRDIAELLPDAAGDADVTLTFETTRTGDPATLIGLELATRLVHAGWTFNYRDPDAHERAGTPDTTTNRTLEHAVSQDHQGNPACKCGWTPPRDGSIDTLAGAIEATRQHAADAIQRQQ